MAFFFSSEKKTTTLKEDLSNVALRCTKEAPLASASAACSGTILLFLGGVKLLEMVGIGGGEIIATRRDIEYVSAEITSADTTSANKS